ncbi:hypothetical protein V1477_008553 [Vespula maculifrons]|uniref:Uncharacterized protein n=1 Tax=Vespula maculifrons TaxID=7453 RepID=A0ABD2CDD1_VESMC
MLFAKGKKYRKYASKGKLLIQFGIRKKKLYLSTKLRKSEKHTSYHHITSINIFYYFFIKKNNHLINSNVSTIEFNGPV